MTEHFTETVLIFSSDEYLILSLVEIHGHNLDKLTAWSFNF